MQTRSAEQTRIAERETEQEEHKPLIGMCWLTEKYMLLLTNMNRKFETYVFVPVGCYCAASGVVPQNVFGHVNPFPVDFEVERAVIDLSQHHNKHAVQVP